MSLRVKKSERDALVAIRDNPPAVWGNKVCTPILLRLMRKGLVRVEEGNKFVVDEVVNSVQWQVDQRSQYEHIAEYDLAETLPLLQNEGVQYFPVGNVKYRVVTGGARYRLFMKSPVCVGCGLTGTILYLDRVKKSSPNVACFNLYGQWRDGLVLLTKDHIVPRSGGGPNSPKNYQTMCMFCNATKDDKHISVEELWQEPSVALRRLDLQLQHDIGPAATSGETLVLAP